jgi:septum formation protein
MFPLVLASNSPRRLELLRSVGLLPHVCAAGIDETRRPDEPVLGYTLRLARQKAERVAAEFNEDSTVLGADTVVHLVEDSRLFGKPSTRDEARTMLLCLSGSVHEVVTAYHLRRGSACRSRAVRTLVRFRELLTDELEAYLQTGEWRDKAGAYAVQGIAAAFVRSIDGSYTNVVGLPLCEVLEDLRALGSLPPDFCFGSERG